MAPGLLGACDQGRKKCNGTCTSVRLRLRRRFGSSTSRHPITAVSGVQVRWADKRWALELFHLGLAASERHQHVHHYLHFTPEQLSRITDERLDRKAAAHTRIVALGQEVAAAEVQQARFGGN